MVGNVLAKRKLKSLIKDFFLVRNYPVLRSAFQIPSHLTIPERVMLYKLSKGTQYGLEIGSFIGASASCFCSGMSLDGHLTCVDTWQNDAMAEGRRSTFEEFKKNTDKFSRIITPIRGKSIDAINGITIPLHSLDFLFIDGDHSYESVRQDFLLYCKLLRNGGLLIFHDYACDDVKKVIAEDVMQFVTESDSLPNLWWGKYTSNA